MEKKVNYQIKDHADELAIKSLSAVTDIMWADKNEGKSNGGEVFTPHWCVVDMCNLVQDKLDVLDSTVLEPACGSGNILIDIVRRKLAAALRASRMDVGEGPLVANIRTGLGSVYGVDIAKDNVLNSRKRLKYLVENFWGWAFENNTSLMPMSDTYKQQFEEIIDRNIIWGNTLDGVMWDTAELEGTQKDKPMKLFNWKENKYEYLKDDAQVTMEDVLGLANDSSSDEEVDDF